MMGVYTPSNNELSELIDYLRSQCANGLPPNISVILNNLENSASRAVTDDQPSYEQRSGSYAYPTPQPESPAKAPGHNFRSLVDGDPDQTYRINDVSFSFDSYYPS